MTIISSNISNVDSLYQSEGVVRASFPQETLRISENIGKKIGVTRVANVTHLDKIGIPVALVVRPNSRLLSVAQGKGLTFELAKISALMESIEVWHAENLPVAEHFETYSHRKDSAFVQPSLLANSFFDTSVLDHWQLAWLAGEELLSQQSVFIPREALNLNSCERSKAQLLFGSSSNGLASGNTLEEALCYGILEVIERDAYSQFEKYSPEVQASLAISLETVVHPMATKIFSQCEQAGAEVTLYDLTSIHGIPVFVCFLHDHNFTRHSNHFMGAGAHYLKNIALIRALTEAAQVRLTYISGSRDDVFPGFYAHTQPPLPAVRGSRNYAEISELIQQENFSAQLENLLTHLKQRSIKQVIYYNHTRTDFALPVVRVFIPGMRSSQ